ncbi:MAG: glycerate kinase [Armatimonadota bacterium]
MNIIVAPDSFKGSLTAMEAADAIVQGVRDVAPDAEIVSVPLADGGEGTMEALVRATEGRIAGATVTGPMGEAVEAHYGVLGDDVTGVVEMAEAAGLSLVPAEKRDPRVATTFGVGELMLAALDAGCTQLIVGLGGSATNDGGAGMAQALGARLLGPDGKELRRGGGALAELARIDVSRLDPRIPRTTIYAASDVTNPLCGPNGASAIYGPQKGADAQAVAELDKALWHYGGVIAEQLGVEVREMAGAGAAGGLGAGLIAFAGAKVRSGASLVLELLHFEEALEAADLVLTGEGRIDGQIEFGKAISGVALLAEKHGVPVVALTGCLAEDDEKLAKRGVAAVMPITAGPISEQEAMDRAGELLQAAAERVMRLMLVGRRLGDGRWLGS